MRVAIRTADPAPKYLQLARLFERQLRSGVLRIGDRLPSVRQLRDEYRISVATAVGCYFWLEQHGYVRARPKSGFYVSGTPLPDGPPPAIANRTRGPVPVRLGAVDADTAVRRSDMLDLGPAVIAPELLPMHRLNRSLRMAMSAFEDHAVRYEDPRGNPRLRRQIARLLFRRGATCAPDDILITAGGTEALSLCVRAVTNPGDVVAVESPGCYEILQALQAYRLRAVEIPHIAGEGIDRDALAAAIDRHKISAVLMEATCHNALGDCVSDASKAAIVALAARHAIPIIEGDAFGELIFSGERPRPLKAFDTSGIVIQCASLAHHVAPGFNIGWASAGRWHRQVERWKGYESVAGAGLPQIALAEFLESGGFDRHIRRLRVALWQIVQAARHEILLRFPAGTRVSHPEGGFVLWVQLPPGHDGRDVQRRAAALGIRVLPGTAFSVSGQYKTCIRIACGHPFDRLRPAIRTLARMVAQS
jgi:DNA-binding transcriptional MocR family regulator